MRYPNAKHRVLAQNYQNVTMQVGWQLGASLLRRRNYQQKFDDFAKLVVLKLKHLAIVDVRTIYSVGSSMREVKFSASSQLPLEEWTDAIQFAAEACQVISDQSMWSFE